MNCITLNTDASLHHEKGVGGWAFSFRHEKIYVRGAGPFKTPVKDSTEAELKAIGNGLAEMLRSDLPKCRWFVINSDSVVAMNRIRYGTDPLSCQVRSLRYEVIKKLGSTNNHMRHVKAHTDVQDKRSAVNRWCDEAAKREMRKQLKK